MEVYVISHRHANFDSNSWCRSLMRLLRRLLICAHVFAPLLSFARAHVPAGGVLHLMVACHERSYHRPPKCQSIDRAVLQYDYSWWRSLEMLAMLRAGVLCAHTAAATNSTYLLLCGVHVFTMFDDSALQRVAYRRMKSIFGRCLAARATCTMHPEKVQKHSSSWGCVTPLSASANAWKLGANSPHCFSLDARSRAQTEKKTRCQLIPPEAISDYWETQMLKQMFFFVHCIPMI